MKAKDFIRKRLIGHNLAMFTFIAVFVCAMLIAGVVEVWWPTILLNAAAFTWILYYQVRYPVSCPFCNAQVVNMKLGNYCCNCGNSLEKAVPSEK